MESPSSCETAQESQEAHEPPGKVTPKMLLIIHSIFEGFGQAEEAEAMAWCS